MEIECYSKVDSSEFISNCPQNELPQLCQDVFDELSDADKAQFLDDNSDYLDRNAIIDLYQDKIVGE